MRHHLCPFTARALLLALLVIAGSASAQERARERAQDRLTFLGTLDASTLTQRVGPGESLRIEDLALTSERVVAVELERFSVFAPDATVIVHGDDGETAMPVPHNLYFRGRIVGEPDSSVTLAVLESGGVRGLLTSAGERFIVASPTPSRAGAAGSGAAGVEVRRIDGVLAAEGAGRSFTCGTDDLDSLVEAAAALPAVSSETSRERTPKNVRGTTPSYTARVAIETDYEFLQLFSGSTTQATDYIGDLFAYISGMYSDEVDTSLVVSSISLWTTTSDPWDQSSSLCALYQFGRYWNDNHGATSRTIAHFLSGKNTNVGVAWVGVLCGGGFNVDLQGSCPGIGTSISNYGGAYGVTAGIDGNFDLNNPGVVWDIDAVAHEIGHNFNSPHTHCYEGVGGNAAAVDQCYSGQCGNPGCYCGPSSLPCAQSGAGCGTVMSYCHSLSGGLSNISLTLGAGHPYGTAPGRVPSRMNDHVVSRAFSSPGCLDYIAVDEVFDDGFESGDTDRWSSESQ